MTGSRTSSLYIPSSRHPVIPSISNVPGHGHHLRHRVVALLADGAPRRLHPHVTPVLAAHAIGDGGGAGAREEFVAEVFDDRQVLGMDQLRRPRADQLLRAVSEER